MRSYYLHRDYCPRLYHNSLAVVHSGVDQLYLDQHTPEEGQRVQCPKYTNNNKDEVNSAHVNNDNVELC